VCYFLVSMFFMFCECVCLQKNLWKYGDFREDEDKEFGYRP